MTVCSWYMKRQWLDQEPGIEAVYIHYTWTPLNTPPDWQHHRATRLMEKQAMIREGMGGTMIMDGQIVNTEVRERPASVPDNARVKILKLPTRLWAPHLDDWTENYLFHHYFEVHQEGRVWHTALFSEEIVSHEIAYIDHSGTVSDACAHWSLFDFDAQQYVPSEPQEFIDQFGEDHAFRSFKLYRHPDREAFMRQKVLMLRQLPLPRRWRSKVWGPRGAQVIQGWHVRFVDALPPTAQPLPLREAWVDYKRIILGQDTITMPPEKPAQSTAPPPALREMIDVHARLEAQVGELYVALAARFANDPQLYGMWSIMALDEGGHAAVLRAISQGLLSGALQAKPDLIPLDVVETLPQQIAAYRQRVREGVTLDEALQITWELESSELDFIRDLLIASSHLAALSIPTHFEDSDTHTGQLRRIIQQYTTNENLRREIKLLETEGMPQRG